MAYSSSKIRIYKLVDIDTYSRYARDIAFILFGLKNMEDPQQPFYLSEGTGWISYSNLNLLWKKTRPVNIPTTGEEAFFPAHWDPKLRIPRGQVVAAASIVSPKY